jgi:hypothetical protein
MSDRVRALIVALLTLTAALVLLPSSIVQAGALPHGACVAVTGLEADAVGHGSGSGLVLEGMPLAA